MKPKRRSPSVPNRTKGTFMPGSMSYRIMAYVKEAGRATSREIHQDALRDITPRKVRGAISDLVQRGALVRVAAVREPGVRQMVVYAHPDYVQGGEVYAPLPPIDNNTRSLASKYRLRARAPSVFQWKGHM
jgi:hypothetical protein